MKEVNVRHPCANCHQLRRGQFATGAKLETCLNRLADGVGPEQEQSAELLETRATSLERAGVSFQARRGGAAHSGRTAHTHT